LCANFRTQVDASAELLDDEDRELVDEDDDKRFDVENSF